MLEKRTIVDVQDAIARCIDKSTEMPVIAVGLEESLGYYLAEDIIATYDIPMFDKSPYDGYAIRSAASVDAHGENRVSFKKIDHIGAGSVSAKSLRDNEAVRIMTGAPIPEGADAVVMLEQTVETEEGFTLRKPFKQGENISKRGEECTAGDTILTAGTLITPGVIAVLATFSYNEVKVRRKPTVALIATGSELASMHEELTPGKIRNSNGPMIASLLRDLDIETESYSVTADHYGHLLALVQKALNEHDIVITTGGVSVGDFDYMPAIYKALEADVLFNKVAMRPGSVTTVAVKEEKMLFGLSGNPSACYSGFELFTKPVVKKMMGAAEVHAPVIQAKLSADFTKANPFTRFVRAELDIVNCTVKPAGFNKSNAVVAIAKSNSMIILPGGTRGFEAGDEVDVLLTRLSDESGTW